MAYSITLAGQDITLHVDQLTVEIEDTLGQGSGAGSSGGTQGRAATIKFNTDLGPMNTAVGAGQAIPQRTTSPAIVPRIFGGPITGLPIITLHADPSLVRQGEIVVIDASGAIVFGGFATKYTDTTTSVIGNTRRNFTTVEGVDYSTSLQRTIVNETFVGQTDIQIIQFVMSKYAPWIDLTFRGLPEVLALCLSQFG